MRPSSTSILNVAAIVLFLCILGAQSLTNVTVDDQSPLITYNPTTSWTQINDSTTASFDFDGGHMLTSDPAATATFTFTGVAIYFLSARWPYSVNTAVTLDDGPAVLLDLVDHTLPDAGGGPATVKSQVVAKAVGLENVTHTLTVSVGTGQIFALVDGLIYTTLSSNDAIPSTTSTPPDQLTPVPVSTTPPSTSKPKKSHKLAIGLSILAVILLILLILLIWWFRSRRDRDINPSTAYPLPTGDTNSMGGARHMRTAYAAHPYGDEPDDEDEKSKDLHVTNPDPGNASPSSTTGAGAALAMPTPMPAQVQSQPSGQPEPSRTLHSPGRFYGALREMTQSPARGYPVPGAARTSHVQRKSVPEDGEAGMYAYSESGVPSQRASAWSRPTVYSQVTAIGLEDEGAQGTGSGMLAPPQIHAGAGRSRASGRSSALGTESGLQGEDRWAYPQTPLAYVPVFKS